MVVIAGIERDAVERARGGDPTQHVDGAITVERRDLDGDDIVDFGKPPPEIGAEDDAADRRLQIETDQRDFPRYRFAMGDDLVFGGGFHRGEAEQSCVVADAAGDLRLGDGLLRRTGEASDHRQRPFGPGRRGFRRQFQHGPVHSDVADCE